MRGKETEMPNARSTRAYVPGLRWSLPRSMSRLHRRLDAEYPHGPDDEDHRHHQKDERLARVAAQIVGGEALDYAVDEAADDRPFHAPQASEDDDRECDEALVCPGVGRHRRDYAHQRASQGAQPDAYPEGQRVYPADVYAGQHGLVLVLARRPYRPPQPRPLEEDVEPRRDQEAAENDYHPVGGDADRAYPDGPGDEWAGYQHRLVPPYLRHRVLQDIEQPEADEEGSLGDPADERPPEDAAEGEALDDDC